MKINPMMSINNNLFKVNFKANNEDEYVYVPLIWLDEGVDSFQYSNSQRDGAAQNAGIQQNPQDAGKGNSKFTKFAKGTAGVVGAVTVIPPGIEKLAKTVEQTTSSVKDSVNNTIDSVAEIKEHARAVFQKNKKETDNEIIGTDEERYIHDSSILAGDTPVQNHRNFDEIHHDHDGNSVIDDEHPDFEDSYTEGSTYYEG